MLALHLTHILGHMYMYYTAAAHVFLRSGVVSVDHCSHAVHAANLRGDRLSLGTV